MPIDSHAEMSLCKLARSREEGAFGRRVTPCSVLKYAVAQHMDVTPVTLEGRYVRLEPLGLAHEAALINAAADGELWNTDVTIIPRPNGMKDYIEAALDGLAKGT